MRVPYFFLFILISFILRCNHGQAQLYSRCELHSVPFSPPDTDGDGLDDDIDDDDDNDGILDINETVSCESFGEIFFNPIPINGDQEASFTFADNTPGIFNFELEDPNYTLNGYPEYLSGSNYIRSIRGNGLGGVTKVIFPNGMRNFKMAVANLHSNSTDDEGTNGSLFETQTIAFYYNGETLEIMPSKITNGGIFNQGTLYAGTADAINQATFVFEIYQEVDSIVNTSIGTLDHTSIRINGICESDSDGDGFINSLDTDSDNDGISDEDEGLGDCDNDGNPDFVDSDPCVDLSNLFIPQGFSPNNDGINDTFFISGLENIPNHRLIIFNRWGNKVFEASPYLNDWEGTNYFNGFNGQKLPEGTYYYILSAEINKIRNFKGWVYLKRQIEFINE